MTSMDPSYERKSVPSHQWLGRRFMNAWTPNKNVTCVCFNRPRSHVHRVPTYQSVSNLSNQSPVRNINSCQLAKSVRQALWSWYRFLDITSFILDPCSLSWLSMLLAMLFLAFLLVLSLSLCSLLLHGASKAVLFS